MTDARARLIGINHVALEVDDVDEALAFYGGLFGFELRGRSRGAMAFLDAGDQFVALSAPRRAGPADAIATSASSSTRARRSGAAAGGGRRAAARPRHAVSAIPGATRSRSCSTTKSSSPRRRRAARDGAGWAGEDAGGHRATREKGLAGERGVSWPCRRWRAGRRVARARE